MAQLDPPAEAILMALHRAPSRRARFSELPDKAGLSRAEVIAALRSLQEQRLVTPDGDENVLLTGGGLDQAEQLERQRQLAEVRSGRHIRLDPPASPQRLTPLQKGLAQVVQCQLHSFSGAWFCQAVEYERMHRGVSVTELTRCFGDRASYERRRRDSHKVFQEILDGQPNSKFRLYVDTAGELLRALQAPHPVKANVPGKVHECFYRGSIDLSPACPNPRHHDVIGCSAALNFYAQEEDVRADGITLYQTVCLLEMISCDWWEGSNNHREVQARTVNDGVRARLQQLGVNPLPEHRMDLQQLDALHRNWSTAWSSFVMTVRPLTAFFPGWESPSARRSVSREHA